MRVSDPNCIGQKELISVAFCSKLYSEKALLTNMSKLAWPESKLDHFVNSHDLFYLGGVAVSLPKISAEQATAVQDAKKFAMEHSVQMVMVKQAIAHQQNQVSRPVARGGRSER